jgi:hypothetical protein
MSQRITTASLLRERAFAETNISFPMVETCVSDGEQELQTISFSPFNGRILTTLRAGLALKIVS